MKWVLIVVGEKQIETNSVSIRTSLVPPIQVESH
jgi:hypothetical protein